MLHHKHPKLALPIVSTTYFLYLLFITFIAVRPIWHYFERNGILPRVSFPTIITVSVGLLILLYAWHHRTTMTIHKARSIKRVHRTYLIGLALLLWVIVVQLVTFPWASQYTPEGVRTFHIVTFSTIISPILMWLSGANIDKFFNLIRRSRGIRVFTYSLYLAFVMTIFYGVYANPLPLSLLSFYIYAGSGADYLMLSDAFAVFTLLIVSIIRLRWLKIIVALLGIILLIATLSRTSLYFYTFAMLLLLILNSRHRWPLLAALAIGAGVALLQMDSSTWAALGESRMFKVLVDLSEDQSLQERGELLELGFQDISRYWLLGSFMQEFADGRPGGYVHNWLSFLIAYGIMPFLVFIALSAVLVSNITRFWLRSPNDKMLTFVFAVTIFAFLSIILARAYTYPYIWFSLAAIPTTIRYVQRRKEAESDAQIFATPYLPEEP